MNHVLPIPYPSSDAHIIQGILLGGVSQERHSKQLYLTFQGLIKTGVNRYQLEREAVEGIYAESIALVIYNIHEGFFRGEAQLGTYLHRIFCNRCAKHLRFLKADKRKGICQEIHDVRDQEPDPCRRLQVHARMQALEAQCEQLGKHCRQIIWDSQVYGYSMQEIAERTGLKSAATVATLKNRYLMRLRRLAG